MSPDQFVIGEGEGSDIERDAGIKGTPCNQNPLIGGGGRESVNEEQEDETGDFTAEYASDDELIDVQKAQDEVDSSPEQEPEGSGLLNGDSTGGSPNGS